MFVPATAQMTFKHYKPDTKAMAWKSVSVGGFKPNGRGCKSDSFVWHFSLLVQNCAESINRRSNIAVVPPPRRNTSSPPTSTRPFKSLQRSPSLSRPQDSNTATALKVESLLSAPISRRERGMDLRFIDSYLSSRVRAAWSLMAKFWILSEMLLLSMPFKV
jgi:hypothetical protein